MKKFTFLLTLLGLSASSAFAGVFTPSTDSETHLFAIKNPNNNYYCTVNEAGIGSTQNKGAVALFKVIAGDEGQYYLYCQTNEKYVSFNNAEEGSGKVIFVDTKNDAKQWKIKLEANQTGRYDIFPNTVAGNNGDLSWNWHGGVGNNMGFYAASDGYSTWTFEEGIIKNFTFNYVISETQVATKTVTQSILGDKSYAPASGVSYTHVESMSPANIVASTTEYTVNLGESLPFTKSESFDNATWYVMDMHSNDDPLGGTKNYVWTFHNADQDVTLPITDLKTATYSDNMLWCFVGNVANGFKIYNKAAGSSLTLRKAENGNNPAVMSTTDDRNQFKIYPSTQSGITGNAFCFKLEGDDFYVNTQEVSGVKVLRGYEKTDGGFSCRVFAPNSFIVNATKDYNNYYVKASELPEGALGTNSYLETDDNLADFKAHFAAANNKTANVDQINALVEDWKKINAAAAEETTIEAGKSYRLYNAKDKKWLCVRTTDNTKLTTDASANNSIGSVVSFTSAESGRFRMMIEGKTIGKYVKMYDNITLENNNSNSKGSYKVNKVGTTFTFQDYANKNRYSYLHCNNNDGTSNVVGWETSNDLNPTYWHVVPATTAEIDMKAVEGNTYATAYLPFNVSSVANADVYVGKLNADKTILNMTKVEGGIPAGKGVVLVGNTAKATLNIGNTTATISENDLVGTNINIAFTNDAPRANYLVFGKNSNAVGFYAPSESVANIPANKAYINASILNNATAAIALNFNGITTGVNTVVLGENGVNAPVFDLSGRRVAAPVKGGVYIQNGKKFIK